MSTVPVITRVGLVTPLGNSATDTWNALLAGRFITNHAKVAIETAVNPSRVSQLAVRAAREATDGGFDGGKYACDALVVGTSKGPVSRWLKSPSGLSDVGDPNGFGLSELATDLAETLGISGPRLTISAACASGLHALIRGALLIRSGHARRVLVVAAEASVEPIFVGSFARLGVLPSEGVGCRPFDRSREGFLMSESAAALVLEAQPMDRGRVAVDRYSIAADATHLTGSDPQGSALRHVLGQTLAGEPIDLLHAHGTATRANDEIELAALDDLVRPSERPPIVYSHKAALGHSLGASGLVAIVLNVMSHRTGQIPPNVRTRDPIPTRHVAVPQAASLRPVRRSLAVAAGFGGAIAAVTLVSGNAANSSF